VKNNNAKKEDILKINLLIESFNLMGLIDKKPDLNKLIKQSESKIYSAVGVSMCGWPKKQEDA